MTSILDDADTLKLLIKWVEENDKRSFVLTYGYGFCEVPFIKLYNDNLISYEGTFEEFKMWVQKK